MKYLVILALFPLIWSCKPSEKTTPSGFKYVHHVKNNGAKLQAGEGAVFNFYVRNEKEVVESSRMMGRPGTFLMPEESEKLDQSISPIVEGLRLMSLGDSLTIMYPTDSFPNKSPQFANSPYIYYDLVLDSVVTKEQVKAEMDSHTAKKEVQEAKMKARQEEFAAQMPAVKARASQVLAQTKSFISQYLGKKLGDKLVATPSGLKYTILEEGTGRKAENGNVVSVHYHGMLTDTKTFDNSFDRGEPYTFPLGYGQVIPGWDEGIALLKEGGKAILFVPSELGYGASGSGSIPPNAELVFYVELAKVEDGE